mmetsp:Transcript_17086/g.23578  ORF Transcript_17086/g.23578 Transcript_17086/m.23578 type:complete len:212 (-) Transcript_17086:530-1165(-)
MSSAACFLGHEAMGILRRIEHCESVHGLRVFLRRHGLKNVRLLITFPFHLHDSSGNGPEANCGRLQCHKHVLADLHVPGNARALHPAGHVHCVAKQLPPGPISPHNAGDDRAAMKPNPDRNATILENQLKVVYSAKDLQRKRRHNLGMTRVWMRGSADRHPAIPNGLHFIDAPPLRQVIHDLEIRGEAANHGAGRHFRAPRSKSDNVAEEH